MGLENKDCYNKYKEELSRTKMYAPYSFIQIREMQKRDNNVVKLNL
jgi:hypothetical protein